MASRPGFIGAVHTHGPWLGLGAFLGIAFCATWWVLVASAASPSSPVEEMVIPPGTADAIARGVPFAFAPDRYTFPPGGRLRVFNRDSAEHRIAETVIPPGGIADVTASESGQLECTVHPQGHLEVKLEGRPPFPAMIGLTALLSLGTAMAARAVRAS